MAAAPVFFPVSVEEYLRSSYEPDVDFVDGLLEDRNLGELDHSALQRELMFLLCQISSSMRSRTFPETRVQVSATRFRVPDLCVLDEGFPDTTIIHKAPLLCVEVLSPEDRMPRVLARCRDFLAMGVREVWVFDPMRQTAQRVLPDGSVTLVQGRLALSGTEIVLDLKQVFHGADMPEAS